MDNFISVNNKNLPNTIVVFSSVNVPEGKFSAIHALKDIQANTVYVNCPNNNWYIKEIPGLGKDIESIASSLRNTLLELGREKVVFYGGSMGAYGALLYAAMCNADHAIVTGVEAKLGSNRGYYNNLCRDKVSPCDFPDLIRTIENSDLKCDILIGESCFSDHTLVKGLSELDNVTIRTVKNGGHRIPPYIQNRIGLEKLLASAISSVNANDCSTFTTKIISDCSVYSLIEKAIHAELLSNEELSLLRSYTIDSSVDAHYRSYALYALSLTITDEDEKLKLLKYAIELNPDNFMFHDTISEYYVNNGALKVAIEHSKRSCEIVKDTGFESFEFYALKLVKLYIQIQATSEVIELLQEIKKTIPPIGKMREDFNALEKSYLN